MRLVETLLSRFRGERKRSSNPDIVLGPLGRYVCFFPNAGDDYGKDGFDLANAFVKKTVFTGDILEITGCNRNINEGQPATHTLVYYHPSVIYMGGERGVHSFLQQEPQLNLLFLDNISSWRRVGRVDPLELASLIQTGIGEDEIRHIMDYAEWKIEQN